MLKNITIFSLALMTKSLLFGQQNTAVDYNIYSLLIKSEITSKTKSVSIIDKFRNDTTSIPWLTESINLKDPQQLEELRFLTRDGNGNSVSEIDTATQNLITAFYRTRAGDTILKNLFSISNVKVFLINKTPIITGSEGEWKSFYENYPSSGGIFEFSNVSYSEDGKEAVFYHSLFRRGLNAHGALTVMKNVNGEWRIKYHINFWQA